MVRLFVRSGWLLGLVLVCLWQYERDWPPARAILRLVHPLAQVVCLAMFFLGCVRVVLFYLVVRPFRQDWQRMRATARVGRDGPGLWDQGTDP